MDLPQTNADLLVAAGDIGVGVQGIRWLQGAGKPVLYVAGNHEYYGGDLFTTYARIADVAANGCVRLLDNDAVVIGDVRFLGATLWTDFEQANLEKMLLAHRHMSDYGQIRNQDRELSPEHLLEANWQTRHWLRQELAKPFPGKTVVITHHAPLLRSWSGIYSEAYRGAYCNDLTDLLRDSAIDLWIHGHVHSAFDYVAECTRVVCNPRGYNGHQVVSGFDPYKTIEI
jgi:DNA repair exonuclease SbcCD nuclease subunit